MDTFSVAAPLNGSTPAPQRIGVIGLGAMGAPMARHLQRAYGQIWITGRRKRPDFDREGFTWAATPRELAAAVDTVLLMLPDLPQLQEMLDGPDGLLAGALESGLLLLVGSTSSAVGVRELDERVRSHSGGRVRLVDTPVSGGEDGAVAGTLSIMVGGHDDDARLACRALAPCGTPVHLGPLGSGQVAKACNQLVVSSTILALGEASVLAERSGLDLEKMWELLSGGYAGSRLLESRREKLISGDDSPSGMARYMVKDLSSAAEIAAATKTNAALLPVLQQSFDEIVSGGYGERDIAVTKRFIAER